jgi:hypothetical protein
VGGENVGKGNDIYYNTGNVGIGNSSPDAKLDVVSTSTVNTCSVLVNGNKNVIANFVPRSFIYKEF